MPATAPRVGILAGDTLLGWQRDALTNLVASGATVVRLPAGGDRRDGIAGAACAAFAHVAWDEASLFRGEALDAIFRFAPATAQRSEREPPAACVLDVVIDGDPPCFEAVEHGDTTIVLRVDRVHPDGTRTIVVRAAVACDPTSYGRTLTRVARTAADLPRHALEHVRSGQADIGYAAAPNTAGGDPSVTRIALLRLKCALRRIRDAGARVVLTERWSVGMLTTPLSELIGGAAPAVRWLELPRGRFWADPFPLPRTGGFDVLCEGYDYRRDRGFLARVAVEADGSVGAPAVLAGPAGHHLSYPYVVAADGATHVVPEQSEARRIALYDLDGTVLRERAVLLDGVAAVDPTPFAHGGSWWMFLTDRDRDDNGELLLYRAPTLHGPWEAHPLNPVVRDIGSARPAGTPFLVDGILYRPGQDCAGGYGSRIAIARVDVLTPTSYRETVVAHVQPHGARGRRGMHTLSARGEIVLVDGKDLVLDAAASFAMLRRYAKRLRARLLPRAAAPGDERPATAVSAASSADTSVPATLGR